MKLLIWLRSRLLYKMLLFYSLLTLIPLAVVSVTFYSKSKDLMEKKSTEAAQEMLAESAARMDAVLSDLSRTLYELGKKQLVLSLLTSPAGSQRDNLQKAVVGLLQGEKEELVQTVGDYVADIYLQDASGQFYPSQGLSDIQYRKAFDIMPVEYEYIPEWAAFTDRGRIACNLKLYDKSTGASIGKLILLLDARRTARLYEQFPADRFYITNSNNIIVSAAKTSVIGSILNVKSTPEIVALTQKSRYSDFQYVYLVPSKPGQIMTKQAQFSFYVAVVAWLCVIVITFWMLRKVTVPISKLTRLMRRAGKEEYVLMDGIRTQDEIAVLCHGYNHLVNRTQELIEKTYKAELLQREAELKSIRMYVNPHFLYNTLEHISIQSRTHEGVPHIPEIVRNLADIFRFSITPGESTVPLETELAFVDKYLQIHQYRYKSRLKYEIRIEDEVRHIAVPKLLLQPIVENAIIHGIDKLAKGGSVVVRAYEQDFELIVEVENTWREAQMPAEDQQRRGLGTGLDNVKARIHFHYGKDYGVHLLMQSDRTVAKVTLPIIL